MRYARHPEVLWRSTSGGPVLLAPDHDRPERLGGMAAVVWEVLDRPMTHADVAQQAAEILGSAAETSVALTELSARGLVTSSR